MEVVVPVMAPSAPCSPRTAAIAGGGDHLPGYCYFFSSAPASPSRASYAAGDTADDEAATFDFTLGFSGQLQEATPPILAPADELFEGGRIRTALSTPHPSILLFDDIGSSSASTTGGPRSPRRAGGDHQAAEAMERGRSSGRTGAGPASAVSSRSRRATRSLSPFRGGGGVGIEDDESPSSPSSPRTSMMRGCGSGSKKWRLKDLFLFRSASEGRATGGSSKDPLFKYTMLSSSSPSGGGTSSSSFSHPQKQLRSAGEGSASMRKGRGSTASASDMPYTTNRAAAEDVRRRTTTPLPFHRNSLFGYLRSNPAIHSISRKLGSHSSSNSSRGRPTT